MRFVFSLLINTGTSTLFHTIHILLYVFTHKTLNDTLYIEPKDWFKAIVNGFVTFELGEPAVQEHCAGISNQV